VLIEPEAFAGVSNARVCEALEAEGVGAWEGYEPMSRYDLFQPGRSRLPVAVEHAGRLDPATMSFPVAEEAALRRTGVPGRERVPGRPARGRGRRSRPWPRSSATPPSWPASGRTSAGRAGWPPAGRPAGARRPGSRRPAGLASSALRATARSPVTAASTARRS
jgi:hypothetical protein